MLNTNYRELSINYMANNKAIRVISSPLHPTVHSIRLMLNTNYRELSINYMANYMAIRVKKV